MSTSFSAAPLPSPMQRLAALFHPQHARGVLFDGPAHRSIDAAASPAPLLAHFVLRVRQLLAATDEAARQRLEQEVLDLSVPLHAAGLFEVLQIAHAPLATMVADHLATATGRVAAPR
ncbi:MAG: hypothetical protein ACTHNM_17560 [Dyella sp.]|uniref:hypothetical protein n=1 Tax=Dyella sp. TaxID=1869338 RepID=UPI003F7D1871